MVGNFALSESMKSELGIRGIVLDQENLYVFRIKHLSLQEFVQRPAQIAKTAGRRQITYRHPGS
jgi:hypothetical protein